MVWFFSWFALSVAVGAYGASKVRSGFRWFVFAALLSPLLGFIFCAIADDLKHPEPNLQTHIKCPDCRELVLRDARKCKHCGSMLVPQIAREAAASTPSVNPYAIGREIGEFWVQHSNITLIVMLAIWVGICLWLAM